MVFSGLIDGIIIVHETLKRNVKNLWTENMKINMGTDI